MAESALIPEQDLRRLSPSVVRLWRWRIGLETLLIAVAAAAVSFILDYDLPAWIAASAALLIGVASVVWWAPAVYRSWTFAVREEDVVIQRGVWWRVTSIVPHPRIQHVDTTNGPWERRLGLSSVVLFTAGHVGASIKIPGLPAVEAEELRDTLVLLGRKGEAV